MTEYHVKLPLDTKFIESLKVEDVLYIDGVIMTARDQAHQRILKLLDTQEAIPEKLQQMKGGVLYHCGPVIIKDKRANWKLISAGPTTSARLNPFNAEVCKQLGIKVVIGKGGMENENWGDIPAVYCVFPGGVGALFQRFITEIKSVLWLDLGMPEAIWFLECNKFGPLLVGIDTHGNSIF